MAAMKPAKKAATERPADRRESVAALEPLRLPEGSRHRPELIDLVVSLAARSSGLKRALPPGVAHSLSAMVRSMNCYYSNLIEGHDTHPIDIERALQGDYSREPRKRDLQLEARAHIDVQQWLDEGGLAPPFATVEALRAVHRRFCSSLPAELLQVLDPATGERVAVVAGEWRTRDVAVGGHRPVSPGAIPRFVARFEAAYAGLGTSETLLSLAAAHHRLLWIHPFVDGNGRVARLLSHATVGHALETGALWSIARGLSRNVNEYKRLLAECDLGRRNDLDGRGALSEEALAAFTRFFLVTCIDQVDFMERLVQPARLRLRILAWAEERTKAGALPAKSARVLEALLHLGELPRGEVAGRLDTSERNARRAVAALVDLGVVTSEGPRAHLRLRVPATVADRWMPGLFPPA